MKSTSLIELAGAKHVTGGGQCGTGPIHTRGGIQYESSVLEQIAWGWVYSKHMYPNTWVPLMKKRPSTGKVKY